MEKYMGNKSKICKQIFEVTSKAISNSSDFTVFDPFAGTTNVSRYFKKNGINVICNDINDLSYVLAKCYIECCSIPTFNNLFENPDFSEKIHNAINSENINFDELITLLIQDNRNTTDSNFMDCIRESNYLKVLVYLTYIASEKDWNDDYSPYYLIQKNYCEHGANSKYLNQVHKKTIVNLRKRFKDKSPQKLLIDKFLKYPHSTKHLTALSEMLSNNDELETKYIIEDLLSKNLVGKRRFFSLEHGKRFDIILNLINYWRISNLINDIEFHILLTSVIESIAIFSNTSATYQAFYKDYRANTKQRFRLVIPEIDTTKIESEIYQEDVCSLIPSVKADVLYLDPPYNWRQYDSNYHLLNTVAKFHKITDWQDFEKGIVGASGENREKKLSYTSFNTKKDFEKLLFEIIDKSQCKTIVLSYSDSRSNHERDGIKTTLDVLNAFFSNKEIFQCYQLYRIQSVNFESRKGNKKNDINELLFVARKKD